MMGVTIERIKEKTKYEEQSYIQEMVFGHYHDNKNVNVEEILLYEQIIRIA